MPVCLRTIIFPQILPGSGIRQLPPNDALEAYAASELRHLKAGLIFFYPDQPFSIPVA
jgi:hypothetical protein